jgi:signal peptidase I
MNIHWFLSRTVRHAGHLRKHVGKYLSAQRDILPPANVAHIERAMADLRQAADAGAPRPELLAKMTELETAANKWLKPHPNAAWRENIEVLLVAIAVAMGIRTFLLQPFKIPTGSMQPTLFGITSNPDFSRSYLAAPTDLAPRPDFEIPNPLARFYEFWWRGIQYKERIAQADGALSEYGPPRRFLLFNLVQRFQVGDETYTVWFPPEDMLKRAGLVLPNNAPNPKVFRKGELLMKIKVVSGDHLFVDRLTYNFRRPRRGEILVFETRGIQGLQQDQYYIKRMVALGGDKVRLGNDRHLVINGGRLDAGTPHFENVYGFNPAQPPQESKYSGHVNQFVANEFGLGNLASLFPDENPEFLVPPEHYIVMGDNTVNSYDSRAWGDFPRGNVIGKSFFVYWPFGSQNGRPGRFGWGNALR